ncbi:MAG: nitronate monooxygenase [Marinosulfonomonas sp.]|nr:nitronate monooxygenase [Marinosulfonomonas sp.]
MRMPVIVAPMFQISGPDMVIASCRAGAIGSFPAAGARKIEDLDEWCDRIIRETKDAAPWALNLLTHPSYIRHEEELEIISRHRPPLVITALGSPKVVIDAVHEYGGLVFADVARPRHAKKALAAGVDGLVLLCAGAGGHTGTYSPFAFVDEVREFWDGPIVLSGAISNARNILAAEVLGADFAYMGTRFLAAKESLGVPRRKDMVVEACMEDIIASAGISGVLGNWFRQSLEAAGVTDEDLRATRKMNMSAPEKSKPWKDIWGAGHGVSSVTSIESVAEIIENLRRDYIDLGGRFGTS